MASSIALAAPRIETFLLLLKRLTARTLSCVPLLLASKR